MAFRDRSSSLYPFSLLAHDRPFALCFCALTVAFGLTAIVWSSLTLVNGTRCGAPLELYAGVAGALLSTTALLQTRILYRLYVPTLRGTPKRESATTLVASGSLQFVSLCWSIAGCVWVAQALGCPGQPSLHSFCVALAVFELCAAVIGAVGLLFVALGQLNPEDDDDAVLRYARCSCCSYSVKRLVCVALPLLAFCITSVALVAGSWNERCQRPLHEYLIVTGCLFVGFTVAGMFGVLWPRRSARSTLTAIVIAGIASLAWAIVGAVWTSSPIACADHHLWHAAVVGEVILFIFGSIVLCLGACCKLETHLSRPDPEAWHSGFEATDADKGSVGVKPLQPVVPSPSTKAQRLLGEGGSLRSNTPSNV